MTPPVDGPAVVAVGGGHGLAATLRAAATYAGRLTAVVSVADDGGSSGRLRASTGLPAVGDLRRCLTALAAPGRERWARLLEHRFGDGELQGHALGNLVIAALVAEVGGLAAALDELARELGVDARVLPATEDAVTLVGETVGGVTVRGQVAVARAAGLHRVGLDPPTAVAPPAAVDAIATADQVVLGPGSLYTSVLAALAVTGIGAAVNTTKARTVYVANLRPQAFETSGYDLGAHVAALRAHGIEPDVVLCHTGTLVAGEVATEVVEAPVARSGQAVHDPELLGRALADLV